MKFVRHLLPVVIMALTVAMLAKPAGAAEVATPEMQRTWEYSDKPVADGQAVRSWIWGPEAFTPGIIEEYVEGSLSDGTAGHRLVQYQDKSRMEITNPNADKNSIWYVTNGLLAAELTSGRMQVGNNSFVQRGPAFVNVAGDANDPNGITYQTMGAVAERPALSEGTILNERLSRTGTVTTDTTLDARSIRVGFVDTVTQHGIAQPFWEFMNATGTVYQNGQFVQGNLFENPFFATGRPITEAYWQDALVGGTSKLVLTQCFERRCLTYTPDNAPEWRVEMGNIGLHYYTWRYESAPATSYVFDFSFGSESEPGGDHQAPQDVAIDSEGNLYLVDVNANLVHKYDPAGTWLMSWGGFGTQNGQFNGPFSITVDSSGNVYVADSGNDRVQKFDQNGNWLLTFFPPIGGFNGPAGIEADGAGNVYVTDSLNHSVYKYDSNGDFVLRVGSADSGSGDGEFGIPLRHITVSPDNSTIYVVDAGNYRIQAFSSDGTYLRQWGSEGSGDGQFASPWGIGISPDGGTVYVSDTGNRNVQAFDTQGSYLRTLDVQAIDPARGLIPVGMTLPSNDTLYIVEKGVVGIQVVAASDGSFIDLLAENTRGKFRVAEGIATTANGDFIVVDSQLNQVKIFDAAGNFLRQWGRIEHLPNDLDYPYDVAVDSVGMIYVTENGRDRVTKFDSQGTFQTEWGEAGSEIGEFNFPQGIDIDTDDNVYIVDTNNGRIQKFTRSGDFISAWGTFGDGPGQFNEPRGIAVHDGLVYVVDQGNSRVQVFDLDGAYQWEFGSRGDGDGQFSLPSFIDVDARGYIYVTDTDNNRVQKFQQDGTYLAQFGSEGEADGEFDVIQGIVALANGNIAIVDLGNDRVQVFRPNPD